MSFLPISILGYAFTAGAIIIDKILLKHSLPSPLAYTFYISVLGLLAIFFIPFGVKTDLQTIILASVSGIFFIFALFTLFQGLKIGEASVVGPVTGALNPLFTLIIAALFFNQHLTQNQLIAFMVVMAGALILTFNLWANKLRFNEPLFWMVVSGLFWALAYIFLKEAFLRSDILSGIIINLTSRGVLVLPILLISNFRKQIFSSTTGRFSVQKTGLLLLFGQSMGALSGLLLSWGVALANPALVNSLFGVQYLVILIVALILAKNHPQLLDENLTKGILAQKILGAGILSLGVYLLSK